MASILSGSTLNVAAAASATLASDDVWVTNDYITISAAQADPNEKSCDGSYEIVGTSIDHITGATGQWTTVDNTGSFQGNITNNIIMCLISSKPAIGNIIR